MELNKIARVICTWAQHLAKPEGKEFEAHWIYIYASIQCLAESKDVGLSPCLWFLCFEHGF